MRRIVFIVQALVILLPTPVHADSDEKERSRGERRLLDLEKRAKKISAAGVSVESAGFLESETRRLIGRCRTFAPSSYEFDRMLEAVDDLLDAREDLQAAAQSKAESDKENESRGATAKRLERAYFR